MVNQFRYHIDKGILLLYYVVDEDCLRISQFLLLIVNLLRLIGSFVCVICGRSDWCQDDDLTRLHNVDTVECLFAEGGAANEVDECKVSELMPLLYGKGMFMQDDNWRNCLQVLRTKRHHKVSNILDHAADYDVVLGEL